MVNISPKQKRIAKAKLKGIKNKDIGKIEYPEATPESQAVLVSRTLNKQAVVQYIEQGKLIALKKHNVTWDRIVKPISEALDATKIVTSHTEPDYEIVDHTTRLSASKQARELIEKTTSEEIKEQLKDLAEGSSEMEIVQAIFRK